MPCRNRKSVKTYLTPEEYAQIKAQADQAGVSVSTFIKRVCLGQELRSRADQQAVLTLIKVNGDLGRLGGLFKMALSEGRHRNFALEFRQLLRKIEQGQAQVVTCSRAVVKSLNRRRSS